MNYCIVDNWRSNTANNMWHIYIVFAVLFRGAYCNPLINTTEHSQCIVVIKHFGEQVKTLEVQWNSTIHLICDVSCVGPRPQHGLTWLYRDKNRSKDINIEKPFRSPKFQTYPTTFYRTNELVIRDFGPNEETDFICKGTITKQRLEAKVALIGTDCLLRYNFRCKLGNKCIDRSYLCNQHNECPDGEDEVGCGNSFHIAGPWYVKERRPYDFVFTVGTMSIRLSEEDRKYLAGVYTWISRIAERPTVRIEPEKITVTMGTTGILRCIVTGVPAPTITWQKSRQELSTNHQIDGDILRITQATMEDRGIYVCRAENIAGSDQDWGVVEVERRMRPKIDLYPDGTKTVSVGGNAFFQCRVIDGDPPLKVTWSRVGGLQLTERTEVMDTGEIMFKGTTQEEQGFYICTVSNDMGTTTATATLIVQGPPTIVIQPSKMIIAIVGQRVRMECIAQGEPIPSVYWINPLVPRLGDIVPQAGFPKKEGTAIFEITNVGKENTGFYTCVAQNSGGRTEDRVQLFVQEGQRAEVKIAGPGTLSVVDGGSVELICSASAILNPQIRWRRREGPLPPGHSLRGGILSIPQLTVEYGGEYICSTSSPEGSYQASVFIIVTGKFCEFRCRNGTCISSTKKCDGIPDCPDGDDEICGDYIDMSTTVSTMLMPETDVETKQTSKEKTDVETKQTSKETTCRGDQFQCADGNCVDARMKCDGTPQCEDGTDERNCPSCPPNNFQCETTSQLECVDVSLVCNRFPDCTDRSDEVGCPSCRIDQFTCTDGTCVEGNMRCDGIAQCEDGSDEIGCPCPASDFQCANLQCIFLPMRCDGFPDCVDRTDEIGCPTVVCLSDEFRCVNQRKCLSIAFRCNGILDCEDGSDEAECVVTTAPPAVCTADQYKCASGECVDGRYRCDGQHDCYDGSDEENCPKPCEFQCRNGTCISSTKKCDGIPDCPDGDDEICELPLICPERRKGCEDLSKCIDDSQLCNGVQDCTDGGDEKDCDLEKKKIIISSTGINDDGDNGQLFTTNGVTDNNGEFTDTTTLFDYDTY